MYEYIDETEYECRDFTLHIIRTGLPYRFSIVVASNEFSAWVSTYAEDEELADALNDLLDYASQKIKTVRRCVARYRRHMKEEPGDTR